MEDVVKWHHRVPTDAEYQQAMTELDQALLEHERQAADGSR